MLLANHADYHVSPLQSIFGAEKDVLGFPERLRFDKVDRVFSFVAFALPRVKLEYHAVDLIRAAESSSTDCGHSRRLPELKLSRCPHSFAATLAALPSISEFPFLDSWFPDWHTFHSHRGGGRALPFRGRY
jgi:hypothetical protein